MNKCKGFLKTASCVSIDQVILCKVKSIKVLLKYDHLVCDTKKQLWCLLHIIYQLQNAIETAFNTDILAIFIQIADQILSTSLSVLLVYYLL